MITIAIRRNRVPCEPDFLDQGAENLPTGLRPAGLDARDRAEACERLCEQTLVLVPDRAVAFAGLHKARLKV